MNIKTVKPHYIQAILLCLISGFFLAVVNLLAKFITPHFGLTVFVFLRFFIPLLLILGVGLIRFRHELKPQQMKIQFIRAIFTVSSQFLLIYCLLHMPVMNATLLFLTSMIFIPILSRFILGVAVKTKIWISVMLGFIAVIFIIKPTHGFIDVYALLGLLGGLANACSQITLHKASKKLSRINNLFGMYLASSILAAIPLFFHWHDVIALAHTPISLILPLLIFAIASIGNQSIRGLAYSKLNKVSSVSPILYASIIFSGILAWIAFGEIPDCYDIIGTGIFILSGIIILINVEKKEK